MEHTKGKWFNNGGRVYAQQGDDIREICDVGLVNHQSKEDTANARLIVATPDLLAACEVAILALTHKPISPKDIDFIKAAINKTRKAR